MVTLELEDIQGLVLFGYGSLPYASYLFLNIPKENGTKSRTWLHDILKAVTTAAPIPNKAERPDKSLNIALTSQGWAALGQGQEVIATFAREFQEGMVEPSRSRILGDTAASSPENWEFGGPENPPIHILLMLFGKDRETLQKFREDQVDRLKQIGGIELVTVQDSHRRKEDLEHFGYRDGISQPAIAGSGHRIEPGQDVIKAGEFVLGYPNEYDKLPFAPTVPEKLDPKGILPRDLAEPLLHDLGRNGTYLVFRKLKQDVAGFWRCIAEATAKNGQDDLEAMELLAAKCVGRWPSGAPLTLSPDEDDPNLGRDRIRRNDFRYSPTDREGYACPIGSHIRRTNPRDSLEPTPEDSTTMVNRHRLLRRGRSYGDPLAHARSGNDDGRDRGLLFLCINANLERQFEFVQQTWINNPKFAGLYDGKDPLVGDNPDPGHGADHESPSANADDRSAGTLTIQRKPVRQQVHGFRRFVQTRGGGYFFLPGMTALRYLAEF